MKNIYILKVMKSRYCETVFIVSLLISYFLVPETVFYGWYTVLGAAFMALFAFVMTCTVRNVKERIVLQKTYEGSAVGILSSAIGIGALSVCGIGNPVCGATIGAGIVSLLIPGIARPFLSDYGTYIIAASLIIQIAALYFLNCFKRVKS